MTKNLNAVADQIDGDMADLEQLEADMEPANIEGETKAEAFLRLVNKRLPVAVKRIRLIGNLTSANYAYTPEQAAKIMAVLRSELDKLETQFDKISDEAPVPTIE